jgi:hypothetical protein
MIYIERKSKTKNSVARYKIGKMPAEVQKRGKEEIMLGQRREDLP